MTALGFQDQFVPGILDGTKAFTMRREWRNGATPDIDANLDLVTGHRTPARRVFATAKVEFRATVVLVPEGIASVLRFRLASWHGQRALDVQAALVAATRPIPRQGGAATSAWALRVKEAATTFARFDGFEDYPALYAFFDQHRPKGSPRRISRELIGLGLVTASFAKESS